MKDLELNERVLPDDHPVYGNYFYVCDGKVIISDLIRGTVADLKRDLREYYKLEAKEIKNCDVIGRQRLIGINTQK
jgi:hypothetical protein